VNFTKTLTIKDFQQVQQSSISQLSYYLRETWVNKLKEIIKQNFVESNEDKSKGREWFSL
jgi:hypothetical protein